MNLCNILVLLPVALGGCVLAWGKPYKVEFASSTSVTINIDPTLTNMGEVQNIAQQNCAQYGKDAVPQATQDSPWGLRELSFACEKRE